jgi:hypothetical protein
VQRDWEKMWCVAELDEEYIKKDGECAGDVLNSPTILGSGGVSGRKAGEER